MSKTYMFGHKNPDTDSVMSAIGLSYLKNHYGKNTEPRVLGNINKETKYVFDYLGMEEPKLIEKVEKGQNVILVDHNESKQSVDGINEANILKVQATINRATDI